MMLTDRNNLGFQEELTLGTEIAFDLEQVVISGTYVDELSAYRAKKVWIEALESCFLLEEENDYKLSIKKEARELGNDKFSLNCQFTSACARYAFWRITNGQAPEAEYTLETAHIPVSSSTWLGYDTNKLPNKDSKQDNNYNDELDQPLFVQSDSNEVKVNRKWFDKFEDLLDRIVTKFDTIKDSDK